MNVQAGRERLRKGIFFSLLHVLVWAVLVAPSPVQWRTRDAAAAAPGSEETISAAKSAAMMKLLVGEWIGARLLCRKEEDNAVRCGKPVSFSVRFGEDGMGSSTDEHFPNAFTVRWKTKSELILTSVPEGQELTLFQFEIQEGFLTFQTYIYLATQDSEAPKESNYIHYIFDVHRLQ